MHIAVISTYYKATKRPQKERCTFFLHSRLLCPIIPPRITWNTKQSNTKPRMRRMLTFGLITALLGVAAAVGLKTHFAHQAARGGKVYIRTSGGATLPSFFAGLPADPVRAKSLTSPLQPLHNCGSATTTAGKLLSWLGLDTVVYAQTTCTPIYCMGCYQQVKSYSCSGNCPDGIYTTADPYGTNRYQGSEYAGSFGCSGTEGCTCNLTTCFNYFSC